MVDPLATPPGESEVLRTFLHAFGICPEDSALETLNRVGQAFARLPYENLSKILKEAALGKTEDARRHPAEVISDHFQLGTGGTCFSLTAALLHLVRALGWQAEPILADRKYGPNTHCALLIWIDGRPHLLDPGFLIDKPVTLPEAGELKIGTAFNEVILTPREGGKKIDLYTLQQGKKTFRLTFRAEPADCREFLRAWDASFDWDMMHYPLLTRVVGGRQIYLHNNRLQVRDLASVRKEEVDPNGLAETIARDFGIDLAVVVPALQILRKERK